MFDPERGILVACVPLFINERGNFGRFDFRASAPEDIGVRNGDADRFEVAVDRGLVFEDAGFFRAVNYAHDIHVAELWPALAPVAMGHAEVATDFGTCFDFAAFRNGPVEEAVETGDSFAGGRGFDVFEESGESADDFFGVQALGDFAEAIEFETEVRGAAVPGVGADFVGLELFFQREQHLPFFSGEFDGRGGHHHGGRVGLVAGFERPSADVADAEGEDAVCGHEEIFGGTGQAEQGGRVFVEGFADRNFQGGPEAVSRAGDFGIGRADDDVSGEGILLGHEIEGGVELLLGDFPSDEGSVGEFGGKEGLADAADDSGFEHRLNALEHGFEWHSALFGDDVEGLALKAGDKVFGDRKDLRIDRVVVFDGDGVHGGETRGGKSGRPRGICGKPLDSSQAGQAGWVGVGMMLLSLSRVWVICRPRCIGLPLT